MFTGTVSPLTSVTMPLTPVVPMSCMAAAVAALAVPCESATVTANRMLLFALSSA